MARLATVYPDRVGVGHGELCLLERTVGVGIGHWDADKRNQTRGGPQEGKRYLQARVEATGSGTTRAIEGGLCHRVILLVEEEGDGIADVGILVINGSSGRSRREIVYATYHGVWGELGSATGATDCYWEIGRFHGQDGHEAEQGRERGEFGEHH